jgi:hypothetical protein
MGRLESIRKQVKRPRAKGKTQKEHQFWLLGFQLSTLSYHLSAVGQGLN